MTGRVNCVYISRVHADKHQGRRQTRSWSLYQQARLTTTRSNSPLSLAHIAFQLQNNLLGGFTFVVLNGLGLTTETLLLSVVTALSLSELGVLALLVLRNFVGLVLTAVLAGAKCVAEFGNVDHFVALPLTAAADQTSSPSAKVKNSSAMFCPEFP
eukprot:Blabericola_migrator_1__713@NODE_1177_length_5203_cov_152_764213_g800_i0_p4_GENE_NODE_1177_length_5203_cov_152_764213_g800_i0NODE_1177_length_5203_cov_152_764213_g800_i0_p4_ORF_typecomplete_len156_score7_90_NODE_1177_length_5203_cov_152_764213_g800_i015131980